MDRVPARPAVHPRPCPGRLASAPAGLVLPLLAALVSCGEAPRPSRPHVLLVTVDTLRADRLGLDGYERATSPALDALARNSAVFDQASSVSSWTLPSLASLVSSVWPQEHGAIKDFTPLPERFPTLAEGLAEVGYATGAVVNHIFLGKRYGLHQGIAHYDDELALRFQERNASHEAITSRQVTDRGLAWIDEQDPARPWHLWLHYFDPHHVYQPHPDGLAGLDPEDPSDLYDGEIAFTDHHLGRLLEGLRARGLEEDTIVVVVADHGEEFGEHGGTMHRRTLFEEVLRVPLVVHVPGLDPVRVARPVSVVDVAPTLLELAGAPALEGGVGRSLVPDLRGEVPEDRPLLAHLVSGDTHQEALRFGRWKLVRDHRHARTELYDLEADPAELADVAADRPEVVADLLKRLGQESRRARERRLAARPVREVQLDAEDRANLDALGYGGDDEDDDGSDDDGSGADGAAGSDADGSEAAGGESPDG